MRCRTARALLPLLMDEELPLGEHHEVDEHFRDCPECAQLRARYEAPLPALPRLPDRIMSQFGRELDEALDEEIALIELARRRKRWERGEAQPSRAWAVLCGAMMGASATLALFFVLLPWSTGAEGDATGRSTAWADNRDDALWHPDEAGFVADDNGHCMPVSDIAETRETSMLRPCLASDAQSANTLLIRASNPGH